MNPQFEGLLSDMARYADRREYDAQIESLRRAVRDLRNDRDELEGRLAAAIGVREAALSQLAKIDPSNPLVIDEQLRARIREYAKNAFFTIPDPDGVKNFDRARDVGRTFKIPGR